MKSLCSRCTTTVWKRWPILRPHGWPSAAAPHDLVVFGEVGLLGEIRSVSQADLRAREAAALGFRRVVVPHSNAAEIHADVDVIAVRRVEEVAERVVGV